MFRRLDEMSEADGYGDKRAYCVPRDSVLFGLPYDGMVYFGNDTLAQAAFAHAVRFVGSFGDQSRSFLHTDIPVFDPRQYPEAVTHVLRMLNDDRSNAAVAARVAFMQEEAVEKLDERRVAMERADKEWRYPIVTSLSRIHDELEKDGVFTVRTVSYTPDHAPIAGGHHPSVFLSNDMVTIAAITVGLSIDAAEGSILPHSRRLLLQAFPRALLDDQDMDICIAFNAHWLTNVKHSMVFDRWAHIQRTAEAIAMDPENDVIFTDLATCIPKYLNTPAGQAKSLLNTATKALYELPILTDDMRSLLEVGYKLKPYGLRDIDPQNQPLLQSAYTWADEDF